MKCTACHTHLPEFGAFEKRVCPNCGTAVAEAAAPKQKKQPMGLFEQAVKAQDTLLINMLINIFTLLILLGCSNFIVHGDHWLAFTLDLLSFALFAITLLLFPLFLLGMLLKRKPLPKNHRPDLGNVFVLIFLSLIAAMVVLLLVIGIHQNIEYKQNVSSYVEVDAVITKITLSNDDDVDSVFICYSYDGKTYENVRFPFYKSPMREGDHVSVKIDPEHPGKLPDKGTTMIIVGAIFTPLSIAALCLFILRPLLIRKKRRKSAFI